MSERGICKKYVSILISIAGTQNIRCKKLTREVLGRIEVQGTLAAQALSET